MDVKKNIELKNESNENIDHLIKSCILKLFFNKERFESINNIKVNIIVRDIKMLKYLAMPKKIYRKYILIAKENENLYKINISHKEKRIIKELIASMKYKCYTNFTSSNN
jgi:hypothetical protein